MFSISYYSKSEYCCYCTKIDNTLITINKLRINVCLHYVAIAIYLCLPRLTIDSNFEHIEIFSVYVPKLKIKSSLMIPKRYSL